MGSAVDETDPKQIQSAEAFTLTDVGIRIDWCYRILVIIYGKPAPSVVHDGSMVIACKHTAHTNIKIADGIRFDVVFVNCNKHIAVGPGVFVPESYRVPDLMNYISAMETIQNITSH